MDVAEAFVGEVRVDLGGRDLGVAEEHLHGAEVGAGLQEVGRKGVAQAVRRDFFRDAGHTRIFPDEPLHRTRRQAEVTGRARAVPQPDKEGLIHIAPPVEVALQDFFGAVGDKYDTNFITLAAYGKFALF